MFAVAAPSNNLICSEVTQKVSAHGASRNHIGTKPLYNAKNPSFLIDCIKQSAVFLYTRPLKQESINPLTPSQLARPCSKLVDQSINPLTPNPLSWDPTGQTLF
uniref:Uncharacterized protein n=1 Tax=Timema douglasi TaxID=61478 RepID=A0A7R8ZES2_TIMDO|nr:unnamed protein product [Timema douglasi]